MHMKKTKLNKEEQQEATQLIKDIVKKWSDSLPVPLKESLPVDDDCGPPWVNKFIGITTNKQKE